MLYRIMCYKQDGNLLYALETACFYTARGHYWGAEVNPEIKSVTCLVDCYDGKGWKELCHRTINC